MGPGPGAPACLPHPLGIGPQVFPRLIQRLHLLKEALRVPHRTPCPPVRRGTLGCPLSGQGRGSQSSRVTASPLTWKLLRSAWQETTRNPFTTPYSCHQPSGDLGRPPSMAVARSVGGVGSRRSLRGGPGPDHLLLCRPSLRETGCEPAEAGGQVQGRDGDCLQVGSDQGPCLRRGPLRSEFRSHSSRKQSEGAGVSVLSSDGALPRARGLEQRSKPSSGMGELVPGAPWVLRDPLGCGLWGPGPG